MAILPSSSGSLNLVFHQRQNATMPIRQITETMESTPTIQVVRIGTPKSLRSALRSTHTR